MTFSLSPVSTPSGESSCKLTTPLDDSLATENFGAFLATVLKPALVLYLRGDLGVGKTTLVRGMLRGLGFTGKVKSPTYTIVEPYAVSRLDLYHFDFYRFNLPEEYLDAGLDEYFSGAGTCVVEWPDKAAPYLPAADLTVHLDEHGTGRTALLTGHSEAGRTCLIELQKSNKA